LRPARLLEDDLTDHFTADLRAHLAARDHGRIACFLVTDDLFLDRLDLVLQAINRRQVLVRRQR
jgi:hypothetical protein